MAFCLKVEITNLTTSDVEHPSENKFSQILDKYLLHFCQKTMNPSFKTPHVCIMSITYLLFLLHFTKSDVGYQSWEVLAPSSENTSAIHIPFISKAVQIWCLMFPGPGYPSPSSHQLASPPSHPAHRPHFHLFLKFSQHCLSLGPMRGISSSAFPRPPHGFSLPLSSWPKWLA